MEKKYVNKFVKYIASLYLRKLTALILPAGSLHAGQAHLPPIKATGSLGTAMRSRRRAGIPGIAGAINKVSFRQVALGYTGRGIGVSIGAAYRHVVSRAVAGQACISRVRESGKPALLLRARDLAGKAATQIALQVEGGAVPEAPSARKRAVGVAIARQWLALLQPILKSTGADSVLHQRQLSNFRFLVQITLSQAHIRAEWDVKLGVLPQIASGNAGVALCSATLKDADFAAVAGLFGAGCRDVLRVLGLDITRLEIGLKGNAWQRRIFVLFLQPRTYVLGPLKLAGPVQALLQQLMAVLAADSIEESLPRAGLQLEGTDQSLPLFRSTPAGVFDKELLPQDPDGSPLLQQSQILPSSGIMLRGAAPEELRGSVVEAGTETETMAAQFTG